VASSRDRFGMARQGASFFVSHGPVVIDCMKGGVSAHAYSSCRRFDVSFAIKNVGSKAGIPRCVLDTGGEKVAPINGLPLIEGRERRYVFASAIFRPPFKMDIGDELELFPNCSI
jgi:hypothetical protein